MTSTFPTIRNGICERGLGSCEGIEARCALRGVLLHGVLMALDGPAVYATIHGGSLHEARGQGLKEQKMKERVFVTTRCCI